MTIGHVLKLIRTNRGMTQKEMADTLRISQNYLSLIESNRKEPSNGAMAGFANSLNISKEALMFATSDVPEELSAKDAKDFQRLQQNIVTLLLFELTEELSRSA